MSYTAGREPMKSYFIRTTRKMTVEAEDSKRLWSENRIAVHYPGEGEEDTRSLNPEDYAGDGIGRGVMRRLWELAEKGGYVWAESYVDKGNAKVGHVSAGRKPELTEATWSASVTRPEREGSTAVLKTLKLENPRTIGPNQCVGLRAGSPMGGTLVHWSAVGNRLADLVEGREPAREWSNLSTAMQEAACAEYLKHHENDEYPRLRRLLVPVGRTLKDVDIYGIDDTNREIFAQVTYSGKRGSAYEDKRDRIV
jgi:hypothetical protein